MTARSFVKIRRAMRRVHLIYIVLGNLFSSAVLLAADVSQGLDPIGALLALVVIASSWLSVCAIRIIAVQLSIYLALWREQKLSRRR